MNQFYSLDGNFYSFVNSQGELEELISDLYEYDAGVYKIFSSQIDLIKVSEKLHLNQNKLTLIPYQSNFYEIWHDQIPQILANLEEGYNQKIKAKSEQITSHSDPEKINTLMDFSLHVSAFKKIDGVWVGDKYRINRCQKYFDKSLAQDNLKAFLVTNSKGELAGSYCLVETDYDIQLESLSGKSQKYQTLEGFKFPYLMKSILEVYKTNFPTKPLRFSSSKEKGVKLYGEAGCQITENIKAIKIQVT